MSGGRRPDSVLVATSLLFAAHVGLVLHFTPRGFASMPFPFLTSAFAVDAYRADRALRALEATGHLSTYDPQVLAGQVGGLWEPFGSRALVWLAVTAARFEVPLARAFDVLAVSLHALVPVVGYVAARASGASRKVAATVLATWSLLTFFDGLTHYAWFSGRIQFVAAGALAVTVAALADRALTEGRVALAVATGVASAAAVTLHPLPALFGAASVVVAAARARGASAALRGALLAVVVAPVAVVALLALRGGVTSEPLASVFGVGPSSLFWDLVEIPGPGYGAAGSSRTALRVACFVAGVLGWIRRRSDVGWTRRRSGFGALETLAAGSLAVAYLGALVPVAWPSDPYFLAIVAAFATSLPAVELVLSVPWSALGRRGPVEARVALLVAAVVAVPRAARTALTYAPEFLPARLVRGPPDLAVSSLGGINEPFPDPLGYDPVLAALPSLAELLAHLDTSGGRVLTDDASFAGFLALHTRLPVLGPLGERGAPSSSADPTSVLEGRPGAGSAADFVERYGVALIVLAGRPGPFDGKGPLFEDVTRVAGYRVRRVTRPASLVAKGSARVDASALGSVRVEDASGPRVTLRYHYAPGLVCRPKCVVEREPVADDALGFVSIPNPPPKCEIDMP